MTVKYTKDHEWVKLEGDVATVGITEYAQEQLGDVVFVDLPDVGDTFAAEEDACVVESVKAASDIYVPVAGEIVEVNEDLEATPALINTAATTDGWIFKVKMDDASEFDGLLDEDAYKALIS
ncbi:MAG: glycine cleavage system protein GcvH [Alphaproteobacteria bacterium]